MPDPDAARWPWDLRPHEVVCPGCRIAFHAPLGACPTCKERAR